MTAHVAGERFKIGNDQLNFPLFRSFGQERNALRPLPHRKQVLGQRAPVPEVIVYVRQSQSVNFRDIKLFLQIAQPAIEGSYVNAVSLGDQVRDDFLGPGRVAGAFAVDAIKNVGHATPQYIAQLLEIGQFQSREEGEGDE